MLCRMFDGFFPKNGDLHGFMVCLLAPLAQELDQAHLAELFESRRKHSKKRAPLGFKEDKQHQVNMIFSKKK